MKLSIKKVRQVVFLILGMVLVMQPVQTIYAQNAKLDFLHDFIQGRFRIIGQQPDAQTLYSGTMRIYEKDNVLYFDRQIDGQRYQGKALLQTSGADSVPVLRITWLKKGKLLECTYLIHSDLDNYPRLTGYIYLKKGQTKQPGLEALFPVHE